ncbi:MAG: bifunctional riboflavin kinase/FAD synthetase [Anaerolineae bacterium]|nr:bifunctional riboflavin kinase/FAD synthetase [Anaerolineae bacterium]
MQHIASLQDIKLQDAWLTIGSFDGVHLGHRQILKELTAGAHAHGAPAVVLTFYPHPAVVLRGPRDSFYLSDPEEKAALLGESGIDVVITQPFDPQIAAIPAADFMLTLKDQLGLRQLWVGHDFALGRDRQGDAAALQKMGMELDYAVHVISPVQVNGEVISSSLIRRLLLAGEMRRVAQFLGRPYRIPGSVVRGDGRGRTLGIPTANLAVWRERAVPGSGVYAVRAHIGAAAYGAVANIGVRPTFEKEPVAPRLEAHLLDFDGEIYGQEIQLEFLERLRGEQRFSSAEELVVQIETDIKKARLLFAGENLRN